MLEDGHFYLLGIDSDFNPSPWKRSRCGQGRIPDTAREKQKRAQNNSLNSGDLQHLVVFLVRHGSSSSKKGLHILCPPSPMPSASPMPSSPMPRVLCPVPYARAEEIITWPELAKTSCGARRRDPEPPHLSPSGGSPRSAPGRRSGRSASWGGRWSTRGKRRPAR